MKKIILLWLEANIWPWKTIAKLRFELAKAKFELSRATLDYAAGYNNHWNNWIAFTNHLYGARLFDDSERQVMRRFYEEGLSSNEAVERLKEYRGIGRYAHPFTPNRPH